MKKQHFPIIAVIAVFFACVGLGFCALIAMPMSQRPTQAAAVAQAAPAQPVEPAQSIEQAQPPAPEQPTATLIPPTTAPVAPDVAASFVSGGLGLSQADWEQKHTVTGKDLLGSIYDGKYIVAYRESYVGYIERQWSTAISPDDVALESNNLIPGDSQLIKTYSPEGRPETVVNLYLSESLKGRFASDSSWTGGEPGNFIVQYNVYDAGVTRMIISTGNNP